MIPPSRSHQVRYHGVLAPASTIRSFIAPNDNLTITKKRKKKNYTYAELLKLTFNIDILNCPRCNGEMRFIACISERLVIMKILNHLGIPADSPF